MLLVLRAASDHREHLPPVVSASTVPFAFDVAVRSGKADLLQRAKAMILQASPPPKVLG